MFAKLTLIALFPGCIAYCQSLLSLAESPRLVSGQTIQARVLANRPAQFTIEVEEGHPARIVVTQHADLKLQWQKDGCPAHVIDSFEFGPETATLRESGTYILEVSLLDEQGDIEAAISREDISAADAELWEKAEEMATRSKKSRAKEDVLASLDLWDRIGNPTAIARTQLKYGDNRHDSSDPAAARDSYEEALTICSKIADNRCIAEAANNSGQESAQLGDFKLALARLQLAMQAWQKESIPLFVGRTLSNLGLLFRRTGDFQQAIAYYDRARRILRNIDAVSYARVLNGLGICYVSLNENEHAISYLTSALAIYKTHPSPKDSVRARLNLGRSWMLSGNFQRAASVLNQALAEADDDKAARADVLNNLGQLAWRRKLYKEGEQRLAEAAELALLLKDRRGQASALHYMGLIAQASGDWKRAINLLDQAAKIRREIELRDDAAESLYALANVQHERGNDEIARKLIEDAIVLLESVRRQVPTADLRAAFYSSKRRLFDLLLEITMASAKCAEEGLLLAERGRGRALLDLLAEGSVLRQLPREFLDRRREIEYRISLLLIQLSSLPTEQQPDIRRQLDLLLAEDAEAEATLRQTLSRQQLGVPLLSVAALREALPRDTTLLEYYLGQHRGYLWAVNAHGVQSYPLPGSGTIEPFVRRTTDLFEKLSERQSAPSKQAAFQRGINHLSQVLLGQLDNKFVSQRLVIVPDGPLYRVPFAALKLPGETEELGLTHDLVQAPSSGYLIAGRSPKAIEEFPKAIAAFADPVFSGRDPRVTKSIPPPAPDLLARPDLARLPFGTELKTIAGLPESRQKIFRAFEASPGTLKTFPLRDFAVIYFASHAVIDDSLPELSRVVLTQVNQNGKPVDGFLRPYHLARLHLNGAIVVLSGCETALGKQVLGEGMEGFSSSLFVGGASQLVLALDKIDAEASSEFFANTFDAYLSSSHPFMERSMTLARRKMAESKTWSDPYYWASFVVIGRPAGSPGTIHASASRNKVLAR